MLNSFVRKINNTKMSRKVKKLFCMAGFGLFSFGFVAMKLVKLSERSHKLLNLQKKLNYT